MHLGPLLLCDGHGSNDSPTQPRLQWLQLDEHEHHIKELQAAVEDAEAAEAEANRRLHEGQGGAQDQVTAAQRAQAHAQQQVAAQRSAKIEAQRQAAAALTRREAERQQEEMAQQLQDARDEVAQLVQENSGLKEGIASQKVNLTLV